MRVFTAGELADGTGEDGRPALVAVDGKVYEVSSSRRWIKGVHMNRHKVGRDLTAEISSAPHGLEVLERVRSVGTLAAQGSVHYEGWRGRVEKFLKNNPFFRRHPHPAVVHMPVGLLTTAPFWLLGSLVVGSPWMERAAFLCTVTAGLAVPFAVLTGYFTWWINYDAADSPIISKKRQFALFGFVTAAAATVIRVIWVTDPLSIGDPATAVYVILFFVTSGLIGYVGFMGGHLTFPYDR